MNVAFEAGWGKVWADGTSPYVFWTLQCIPSESELEILFEAHLTLVKRLAKKFKKVYCITNLMECKLLPTDFFRLYNERYLDREIKCGIKYKAFLVSHERQVTKDIQPMIISNVHFFYSFESALTDINKIRSLENLRDM